MRKLKINKARVLLRRLHFLRVESFFNVASYIDDVGYLAGFGNKSLDARSHGESFMSLRLDKLRGNGLYILDEPEAALSPTRQLAALVAIQELVNDESQFIIATHPPILLHIQMLRFKNLVNLVYWKSHMKKPSTT